MASQCGQALFLSEGRGCARTLRHASVLWCTRLLLYHQNHLEANQTRHQDSFEYNALCVPGQDSHPFTLGPLQHHAVKDRTCKTNKHTFSWIRCSRRRPLSESRRRVHQEPLGLNTLSVHHCHATVVVWKTSATLCGRDSDKATTQWRLPWDHKFSLLDSQPLHAPLPFPVPPQEETCGNWHARDVRPELAADTPMQKIGIFEDIVFFAQCATC